MATDQNVNDTINKSQYLEYNEENFTKKKNKLTDVLHNPVPAVLVVNEPFHGDPE